MQEREVFVRRETAPDAVTTRVPLESEIVTRRVPAATEVVSYRDEPAVAVDEVRAASFDPFASRRSSATRLIQAIYLLFGFIEGLIAIRFVLRLLGANPAAGFAQFIYSMTGWLVAPFNGLFGAPTYSASTLELSSLVALVIYALAAWLVARLAWLLIGETRTGMVTQTRNVETNVR